MIIDIRKFKTKKEGECRRTDLDRAIKETESDGTGGVYYVQSTQKEVITAVSTFLWSHWAHAVNNEYVELVCAKKDLAFIEKALESWPDNTEAMATVKVDELSGRWNDAFGTSTPVHTFTGTLQGGPVKFNSPSIEFHYAEGKSITMVELLDKMDKTIEAAKIIEQFKEKFK